MQVKTKVIENLAVTTAKLAADAVDGTKLANNAVDSEHITDASIDAVHLVADIIDGSKIADDVINSEHYIAGSIDGEHLVADIIDGTKLADDAVDSEHLAAGGIDGEHLAADAKQSVLESKFAMFFNQFVDFAAGSSTTQDMTDEGFTNANTNKTGGSGSVKGVVTDSPSNKSLLRDATTQDPIEDASNRQVYGRTSKTDTALTGTITLVNGSPNVVGVGTLFTSELAVGDYSKSNVDGVAYKILSITDDLNLTLTANYAETGGSGLAASKVALTLSYYVDASGVETAHTMGGETIDVMFPESYDLYGVPFAGFVSGVGFAEALSAGHIHDDRYFTETELGQTTGTTGGDNIGIEATSIVGSSASEIQTTFESIARAGRYEKLTIATQNVLPDLTYTPRENASVILIVEGVPQRYGASFDYTYSGKVGTWSAANAGFNLDTTDEVWAQYDSSD